MSATIETSLVDAPAQPTLRPLGEVVPIDTGRVVRLVAIAGFAVFLVVWTAREGMIWQRLAVAAFLGGFLICAHLGRPLRIWKLLLLDMLFYCAMWWTYETTRGFADQGVFGVRPMLQVESVRNIDRVLFFGTDPNVWLQDTLMQRDVRWWDNVLSFVYFTHFVVPPIVMGALWATHRLQFWRFMRRFATVLGAACVMFMVLPTAPPWMASEKGAIGRVVRHSGRGLTDLGFHAYTNDWKISTGWGNAVAAMPSLHSAFALIVPAFFLPWIKPVWLKAMALVFPATMLFGLVYFGEHWVIDGLVGWLLVGGSFWYWGRWEDRRRRRRAATSRIALEAM
jgi:membrane-associated phospholipid phosphatase